MIKGKCLVPAFKSALYLVKLVLSSENRLTNIIGDLFSVSDYFYENSFLSFAVEFTVEDLLPWTKV